MTKAYTLLASVVFSMLLCGNAFAMDPVRLFERKDISKVPSEPPAPMKRGEFTFQGLTKSYSLFSPPKTATSGSRPLVVFLHGCTQDAEEFAAVTKMNELAIRENFFVLYPEQDAATNPIRCWSWFDPANQDFKVEGQTIASERAWIVALTESIANEINAAHGQIFVAGLSAGAAMAANVASCHPDLFAGAGFVAGIAYGAAGSTLEAMKAMKLGTDVLSSESAARAFECTQNKVGSTIPVIVVQGKKDLTVNPRNARQIIRHFAAFNDLRDDGQANDSFDFLFVKKKVTLGRRSSHGYTTEKLASHQGVPAELVTINGLGHAWSGGAKDHKYSSPKNPQTSEILWKFFSSLVPAPALP